MLKLGDQSISALRLGGTEIKKAYLGEAVVFDVSEPPVPTYTISAAIDPAGTGTVSGAGTYPEGETVTITASPGDGYQFTEWRENGVSVSKNTTYSFVAAGDRVLVAAFSVASRLPSGYTELKYIYAYNNGGSYIKISTYLSNGVLDMDVTIEKFASNCTLFYCNRSSSGSNSYIIFEVRKSGIWVKTAIGASLTTSGSSQISTDTTPGRYHIHCDASSGLVSVNGASKTIAGMAKPNSNIYIGPFLDKNSSSSIKFHECIISNSANTANSRNAHLVPCRSSSGTIGMYDLYRSVFYGPGNTNYPWAAGPAV